MGKSHSKHHARKEKIMDKTELFYNQTECCDTVSGKAAARSAVQKSVSEASAVFLTFAERMSDEGGENYKIYETVTMRIRKYWDPEKDRLGFILKVGQKEWRKGEEE